MSRAIRKTEGEKKMVKGVSGALTRLAKVKSASPQRNGSGSSHPSERSRAEERDEDDLFYLSDDLEALSASQFLRRRAEASKVEPPPVPTPVVAPVPTPPPAPVVSRPDPAPVYADSGRPHGGASRPRTESTRWRDLEEEEDEAPVAAERGEGRLNQRVRRIKTALAARIGRESEPEVPPSAAAAKAPGRQRAIGGEDDSEDDVGHAARGSFRPKQLARARRRLGMTQAEFARCFGLETDDVVRWEAGGRPSRAERVLLTLIMHDPEETARLVDEAMPLK